MNRADRRAFRSQARAQVAKLPDELTEWPRDQWWETRIPDDEASIRIWKSKTVMVQLFIDDTGGHNRKRLSINRVECFKNSANWIDGKFTWDDLMDIKRACGFGDTYAIEVFPRDRDVVNVANIRHLWLLDEPLPIGWFRP